MRIGNGYDVHRFGPGTHVVLGGEKIPCDQGLEAHSDGDVLLHALCDALLGAAGVGDIGRHFPDDDPTYANIDSRALLRSVVRLMAKRGYRVVNVDTTVVAQKPRLAAYIDSMRSHIASDLDVDWRAVNVKATTTEGLGFVGREEGIAAYAVALLEQVES